MMELTPQQLLSLHLLVCVTIRVTAPRFVFSGHRSNYHKDPVCRNGLYGKHCNRECLNDGHCRKHCLHCASAKCSWSGRCTRACSSGYHGTRCSQACPRNCLNKTCERNGSCEKCKTGFRGRTCDEECPSVRCTECHQAENVCTECQTGYYGIRCQEQCGNGCSEGKCSQNGACLCTNGYYGAYCNQTCPANCRQSYKSYEVSTCNHYTGECNLGCKTGWFGIHCGRPCNSGCQESQCSQDDGSCIKHCVTGIYGANCDLNCSTGCIGGLCGRTGDCISGCSSTTYGARCEKACSSTCLQTACDQKTPQVLRCTHGCVDGWWGVYCRDMCPPGCKQCDRTTGACINCHEVFGHMCNNPCSAGCRMSQCSINGICTQGCRDGFHRLDCSSQCGQNCRRCRREDGACMVCKDGFYGNLCNYTCPMNCHQSLCNNSDICNDTTCNHQSGGCGQGCRTGWFGKQCDQPCSTGCEKGQCHQENGSCVFSCNTGYYLLDCSRKCHKYCRQCRRDDGVCIQCEGGRRGKHCKGSSYSYMVLVVFGGVCIVLILLGLCVTIPRRKMRKHTSEMVYLNAVYSPASVQDGDIQDDVSEHIYEEIVQHGGVPLYATMHRSQEPVYATIQKSKN